MMLAVRGGAAQCVAPPAARMTPVGSTDLKEPYPVLHGGAFVGPAIPASRDPLVRYHWQAPKASDGFQTYCLQPVAAVAQTVESFRNLDSLTSARPAVTVTAPGSIRLDFGIESAAWVEFDSPDCPGGVEMGISESSEPGFGKSGVPVQHGHTYRLELNPELYDGVRFAWIHVKSTAKPWHITGVRAVCQVKPVNYAGRFSSSDPLLDQIWYMAAYGVKASLCKDYFGSILMDRGDRMSWTGDAHTTQAAALVAFGNFDFIKQNIDNTSTQSNGIRSYALYWVLSLLDYYRYTGDAATLEKYLANVCAKLDDAQEVFSANPPLKFYGWDERLCAGFEIWFKSSPEAQNAYKMLSVRAWSDFSTAMGDLGRADLRDKYHAFAEAAMASLRQSNTWSASFGLHAAADAINTGNLTHQEGAALADTHFLDRVNRVSFSPFNQYFVIQAMARMGKYDEAISSVRDLWGGMIKNGATTTYEVYRPSWNDVIAPNSAVPNGQSGIVSLCHPWGAGVVKWLNEVVLGIVPTRPGFATYDILPHLGRSLTQVAGESPTPFGNIAASFDLKSGHCSVTAPKGTLGRIGIPKGNTSIASITINGKLAWDGVYHPAAGIGGACQDDQFVYFTAVPPGTYAIKIQSTGTTPNYVEPALQYAATSLKSDTSTGGNWGGRYGNDGYILCNYSGQGRDLRSLPPYVTSIDYFRAFPTTGIPEATVWASATSDPRALAGDPHDTTPRNATCYSNPDNTMSVTIGIDGKQDYQIALYFVDWEKKDNRMVVEMFDAKTLNLIAPVRMVDHPAGGTYLVYQYNQSVKFRINRVRGDRVSLSGIFFDATSQHSTIKDYGLKDYVRVSKDLPHSESQPWKLVCTMPYNCHFQPSIELVAPLGQVVRYDSTNPLVRFLIPTESFVTAGGPQSHQASHWISGEGASYTIPAGVTVKAVQYRETGFATTIAGSFKCNDEDYNILWKKAARTAYLCLRDHFYDCPDRERVGFWGDGTPELDQCFYVFDSASHALARDLVRRKLEPKFYPGQHLEFLGDYGLWFYYLQTGDLETMRAIYPQTKEFLFEKYQFGNPRTWFDWGKEVKDTEVLETCFYYNCLNTLKRIARLTGHEDDLAPIDQKIDAIKSRFDSQYWKGQYYMSSQVTEPDDRANAMAVNVGLADRSKWPAIYDQVLTRKTYSSCFFDRWVFEALCTMGKQDQALLRMYERYKTMIPSSITTLWEHYDRWWASRIDAFDDASSLNHGWNPPALVLSQLIAGVSPIEPGWLTYQVMPREGFLTAIKVVVPSLKGNVTVDLNKSTSQYGLSLTSPAGTTAIVGIPKHSFAKLDTIEANHATVWDGTTHHDLPGVTWFGEDADYVKFSVTPGTWQFVGHGALVITTPKALPVAPPNDTALGKKSWSASASVADGSFLLSSAKIPVDVAAANALDGDAWTGWRDMTRTQYPGQWFVVDMKRAQTFDRIQLDNTWALWDSPTQYAVAVSNDGEKWGSPVATGSGQLGLTSISFPTQHARFIRITQTGSNPQYHWSIYEFDVFKKNAIP